MDSAYQTLDINSNFWHKKNSYSRVGDKLQFTGRLHQRYLTLSRDNSGANYYLAKISLHQPQFAANGFLKPHLSGNFSSLNNNNNNHDNVYGVVHPVHLMNVEVNYLTRNSVLTYNNNDFVS